MRLLLAVGLAALSVTASAAASAQTRIEPSAGALTVSGGQSGETVRVTTYAGRPSQAGRLSRRYRGVSVNRSPQRAASASPGGFASGSVVMPSLRTPRGNFVRRGNTAFRVVRSQGTVRQ